MELLNAAPMRDTVVALGKFDGLHIGHGQLLRQTAAIAQKTGLYALAYTFRMPGRETLTGDDEKAALLARFGMEGAHFEDLTDAFKQLTPEQFVRERLIHTWHARHIVVGFNYRFGRNRTGDTALLLKLCETYGIGLTVIDPVLVDGAAVSSTRVRQAVACGDMPLAQTLLGRRYTLAGEVMPGKRLGREIGFPTVNLYPDRYLILPQRGVYVTGLEWNGAQYPAMTNVGFNPTVEHIRRPKVETHMLDFDRELYGQRVRITFYQKIRDEQAFSGVEQLQAQLSQDVQTTRECWKSLNR